MQKLSVAIEECKKNNYFNCQTVFLKKNINNTLGTCIGINNTNKQMRKKLIDCKDIAFELYELNIGYCMSLILSHDLLLNSLFSKTICLKDNLDISRNILTSLKAITMYNGDIETPSIAHLWKTRNYPLNKKLTVLFYDITGDTSFFFKIFMPIQNTLNENSLPNVPSLQFHSNNKRIDAIYTLVFENSIFCKQALSIIQNKLYNNASELNCRNIKIPYQEVPCDIYNKNEYIYIEIVRLIFDFQCIVLSIGENNIIEEAIVTEIIYAYILVAKIFYKNFADFTIMNNRIYKIYAQATASDTIRYLLNYNFINDLEVKISKEHNTLCLSNSQSLFTNYEKMISNWQIIDDCKIEYQSFIIQLQQIKSLIENESVNKEDVILEIFKHLFHSFNISSYYYSYIPYCIKFIHNEI